MGGGVRGNFVLQSGNASNLRLMELSATCKCLHQWLILPWNLVRLFIGEQSDWSPNFLLQRRLQTDKHCEPVQAAPRKVV